MNRRMVAALVLPALLAGGLALSTTRVHAAPNFEGRWQLSITTPAGPDTKEKVTRTLVIDVAPRDNSLHGRFTVTDEGGRTVPGVWRQAGKKVSIAWELPCEADDACGSIIIMGKIKQAGALLKKGKVIVMWDTPNENNPALYVTSRGNANGFRLESE